MDLTKIVSKDTLRPAMMYAVLFNGYFYATNAHIAVKLLAKDINGFEVNTDKKYFDLSLLKILKTAKSVIFHEEYFHVTKGSLTGKFMYSGSLDDEMRFDGDIDVKFPDIDGVLKSSGKKSLLAVDEIGMDIKFISDIASAFSYDMPGKQLAFEFRGNDKAILVKPEGDKDQIGLLMPFLLGKMK